jgi:hypothetical protein
VICWCGSDAAASAVSITSPVAGSVRRCCLPRACPCRGSGVSCWKSCPPVFARRSAHRLFMVLACGLIADRGTVTGMAAAAGIGRQWRRACWFFASARWDRDKLGIAVARLIVKYLLKDGDRLVTAVDGTFFRRWGRHVAEARWAYDGSAQGGKKTVFGNTWVILALVVRLACCPSPVALPVLSRLWRGKGTASAVELAAEMTEVLAAAFPGRAVHGTATPRSTGSRWSSRARPGPRGCRPARSSTARSRRRRGSAGSRGRRETGSGSAGRPHRPRNGKRSLSGSTARRSRSGPLPGPACGTAASEALPDCSS